ncbi:MAG: gliding motility-associated C-terminal domain-containing protein [Crocinitomicaceae bacterium]
MNRLLKLGFLEVYVSNLIQLNLFLFILFFSSGLHAQLLFQETFDEGDNAVVGSDDLGTGVTWSTACPDCLPGGVPNGPDDFFKILGGQLQGQDTNGPATFETSDIDISSCSGNLEISLDIQESGNLEDCGTGCNSADWVQLQYSYDGGNTWLEPTNTFFCLGPCADNNVIVAGDQTGVVNYNSGCLLGGSTLRIRITIQCWASDEIWMIDNLEVNCVPVVTPTFNSIAAICNGDVLNPLPTTSTNGISGSWAPSLDNTSTTTYTFTPDAGQCAEPVDMTITVNPTFANTENVNVCQNATYTFPDGTQQTITSNTSHISNLTTQGTGCDSIITTNVTMVSGVTNTINVNLCAGQDYTYADGTISTNIQSNESHVSVFPLGSGCDSLVTENLIIGSNLPLDLVVAEPLCFGQDNGSVSINVNAGGIQAGATFVITDADSNVLNQGNSNAAEFLGTGWYFCYVDNVTGCDGMDSVFLDQPDSLYFTLNTDDPLCFGSNNGEASINLVFGNQGPYTMAWDGQVNGEDTISTLIAGSHTALLVDSVGCSAQLDFSLVNPPQIVIGALTGSPSQCRGDSFYPGSGTVSATASGGTGTLNYIWTNGIDTSFNNTWGNRIPDWYYLTVIDGNGCVAVDSVLVDSLSPFANFNINPDFGYTPLSVEVTDQSEFRTTNTWIYNDSTQNSLLIDFDSLQPVFDSIFVEVGFHSICLVVSNDYECYDTLCQEIQVNPQVQIELPNVVTPNGDGMNDVWNPFENKGLQSVTCLIYNRWGNEVFRIENISTDFEGKDMKGKDLADGVYSVVYTALGLDGLEYSGQGFVHVIKK